MDEWIERYRRSLSIAAVVALIASGGLYVLGPLLLRRLVKKWPPFHVALALHFTLDCHGGNVTRSVGLTDYSR